METVALQHLLDRYVERCCSELFSGYGVPLAAATEAATPKRARNGVAGVIGFAGDRVKGSLVLASSFAVIRGTFPRESLGAGEPGADALADWTGELANQLLGRIKNRWLLHGVALEMSTPVSLIGEKIEQSKVIAPRRHRVVMFAGRGTVRVCVEAEAEASLVILAEPMQQAVAGVASEGDVLLF